MASSDSTPSALLKRAHDCARQGDYAQALELLNAIPEDAVTDPIEVGATATAKQHALFLCASGSTDTTYRLALFFRAQAAFYRAIYVHPLNRQAYHLHAAFWHLMGRSDMAVRLLRNLACSAPDEETQRLIEAYSSAQTELQGDPESPPSKGDLGGCSVSKKTPPPDPPSRGDFGNPPNARIEAEKAGRERYRRLSSRSESGRRGIPAGKPAVLPDNVRERHGKLTEPSRVQDGDCRSRLGSLAMTERDGLSRSSDSPASPSSDAATEAYIPPTPPPRVLMLLIPGYDPAMDVLYDGLCTVLDAENVEEYPYKPLLHGQAAEQADDYPTTFHHPGEPRSLEWVCEALKQGYFDYILYGDMLQTIPREALHRILATAGNTPVFVVDGWDDASNNQPLILEHMGRPSVPAYFKREMISGMDYGPNAIPLPLSYPDGLIPAQTNSPRNTALFWAGNRYYGQRRLYLEHLEALLNTKFDAKYSQDEYRQALAESHMGLSLLGFGFDTIRYWEVPAHGALLVAEKPPIVLPHDFTDGVDAVLFDDLRELAGKLTELMEHPAQIPEMTQAGHAHFRHHHTASARARQLLAHLEACLHS